MNNNKVINITVFDPGDSTGYVVARSGQQAGLFDIVERGTFPFPSKQIKKLLRRAVVDEHIVIVEDFIIRKPLIGNKAIAIQVIGAVKLLVPSERLIMQQPSEKQRAPDDMLKRLGLWSKSPHVRDAMRHLIIWQQKRAL